MNLKQKNMARAKSFHNLVFREGSIMVDKPWKHYSTWQLLI